jgi:hypothetical protein
MRISRLSHHYRSVLPPMHVFRHFRTLHCMSDSIPLLVVHGYCLKFCVVSFVSRTALMFLNLRSAIIIVQNT